MKQEVINYSVLDSTNAESARILSSRVLKRTFYVVADYQVAGRGQANNNWVSNEGKNLLISQVVFPEFLSVSSQFQLSKAVSLALVDALKQYDIDAKIKWPNDIIAGGSKIGGILIENSIAGEGIRHSIVGIGLNVNQAAFPEFPYSATSMHIISGNQFPVDDVVNMVINLLEKWYSQLEDGRHELINADYLEHLFKRDFDARFEVEGRILSGKIKGVNEIGELKVEIGGEVREFGFHQLKMRY